MTDRIKHSCSCIIEFIKLVAKEIKCLASIKDKEALSNIAYNETDNISSRAAILRHNNYIFNRYLPTN